MAQTLGQMVIKLGLDSSAFGKGLQGAQKAAKSTMAEMKADMSIAAATGDKIDVLAAKQRGLMKEIQAQANVMKQAQSDYNKSFDQSTGLATADTAAKAKAMNEATMKLAQFQKQAVKAAGEEAVLRTKTTGLSGAVNTLGKGLTGAGKSLSSFGMKATMGVTVPIVTAFAAATKKAMAFQNQMIVIKNLLTTGGESSANAIKEVNEMQTQAVKLSNHYGVSVEKISQGYEDLVRRGYSGSQAVGAMKSELQGALASGDDFNDVVKVASETIEAFGLRTDKAGHQIQSTSKMAAITKSTVNQLAYAADMTATDFQGIGYSMSYVGATAKQAGYGISETSAALGILANNGLSSQKAGTGLRKVLISLTNAAGKIDAKNSVLAKLGIKKDEIMDAHGNLRSLSTVMDVLNKHTAGMSSTKKGIVFNSLFGTTGQQAGMILASNSAALAKLNKQVAAAAKTNYVGQLSEKNLASAQNQLRVFKETISNLGMVLAQDLLPTITPILGDVKKLADKFANLDPKMRKTIVTWLALAAAVGPFSVALGGVSQVFGKTSTKLIGMIANVRKYSAEMKMAQTVTGVTSSTLGQTANVWDRLAGAFGATTPAATTAAGAISKTGAAATTATAGTAGLVEKGALLSSTFSSVGLVLAATAGAVTVGYGAWKLFGEAAWNSLGRTREWGSDVGKTASDAAEKFTSYNTRVSSALSDTTHSAQENARAVSNAFDGMVKSTSASIKKQLANAKELADSLHDDAAAADLMAGAESRNSKQKKTLSQMKGLATRVKAINAEIEKTGSGNSEQATIIANSQLQMTEKQVKTLGISAKAQRQVLKAEMGEYGSASKDQLKGWLESTRVALSKARGMQADDVANLKKSLKEKKISQSEYNTTYARLTDDADSNTQRYSQSAIGLMKKLKMSDAQIKAYLTDGTNGLAMTSKSANEAMDMFEAAGSKATKSGKTITIAMKGLKGDVKKAAETWNGIDLVDIDGKMKTNAVETMQKAVKSGKDWNAIKLLLQEGKMSTNAQDVVAEALAANKQWGDLKWIEDELNLSSNAKIQVADAMVANGQWNTSYWKEAEMWALNKTDTGVIEALVSEDRWEKLTPKQQQLIAQAKTAAGLKKAMQDAGVWNSYADKAHIAKLIAKDETARAVQAAINNLARLDGKTATTYIDTVHRTVAGSSAGLSSAHKNQGISAWAKGTDNFDGGPAIVNDQPGPTFREYVSDPVMGDFIPSRRNTFIPYLSKGAKIFRASITKAMFPGIPQFAGGLNIPASATPLRMAREFSSQQATPVNNTVVAVDNGAVVEALNGVMTLLGRILNKDQDVYIDKTKAGAVLTPEVTKNQNRLTKISNRNKGRV